MARGRMLYVSPSDEKLIDLFDDLGVDIAAFVATARQARADGTPHPLTIAAARIERATFTTSVERGETAAPTPADF